MKTMAFKYVFLKTDLQALVKNTNLNALVML